MGGKTRETDEFNKQIMESNNIIKNQRAAKEALNNIENYDTVKGNMKKKGEDTKKKGKKNETDKDKKAARPTKSEGSKGNSK
jgi:hypothetical protein